MSPLEIGSLGLLALFTLILLQIPIAFSMVIIGVSGLALQTSWGPAFTLIASETSSALSSVDVATVPLFILMGTFATVAGFPRDLYAVAGAFLGHRRGGLAYATIGGSAAFGLVCGSSAATAATFGKAALPEMRARGYSPAFASGTIAAGGALKSMIPPSVVMILYCIATKTLIFDVFTAAVLPALLCVALNLMVIAVLTRLRPGESQVAPRVAWPERLRTVRSATPALLLMLAVFGGLYSGIFTVNEAASVEAVLALASPQLRGRLTRESLLQGLRDSAGATAMIYMILIGAQVFTYFISYARIPEALVAEVQSLTVSPLAVIFILVFIYVILGCIFDEISAMLITLPFVLPMVTGFGYDPVWWGIIMVLLVELGMITPPIGLIVFILHAMAPDIPMGKIFKGVAPFAIADLLLLALLVLFPQISLWLPKALAH
jgi:C4-dicarboxylate transporter, DctM subunit